MDQIDSAKKSEISHLKQRFLKTQDAQNNRFAAMNARRQKFRKLAKERQGAARDRKVIFL